MKRRSGDPAHPMQPIVLDDGVPRFLGNAIIRFLLDEATAGRRCDLNRIASQDFTSDDTEQFWQLLGYSVSGYGDLSFISKETVALADSIADELIAKSGKRS